MTPIAAAAAFVACAAAVGGAGYLLARFGDRIAGLTGLSRGWVGMVLLATVTSLPELVTGIGAVTHAGAPDIAVGNVLGAMMVNLAMLGVLALAYPGAMASLSWQGPRRSAAVALAMLAAVAADFAAARFAAGPIGLSTPVLLLLYAFAVRSDAPGATDQPPAADPTVRRALLLRAVAGYAACAIVVVAAASALPHVAVAVAEALSWHQAAVGTLFVAAATSLPELAVTIAAVRLRAFELAVGNLLGSNLFDLAILALDDIAFLGAPLLHSVSPLHGAALAGAAAMGAVALLRPARWTGVLLLGLYPFAAGLLR